MPRPPRPTPSQAWRSAYRSWCIQSGHPSSNLPPDPFNQPPSSSSRHQQQHGRNGPSKFSKAPAAGGFVVDSDEDDDDAEGDQEGESISNPTDQPPAYLPLASIPDALSLVFPTYEHDEVLLSIFRDVSLPAPRDFLAGVDTDEMEQEQEQGLRRGGARIKVVRWEDWLKVVEALQVNEEGEVQQEGEDLQMEMDSDDEQQEEEDQLAQEEEEPPRNRRRLRRRTAQGGADGGDSEPENLNDSSEEDYSIEEEEEEEEEEDDEDEYGTNSARRTRAKGSKMGSSRNAGRNTRKAADKKTRRKRKTQDNGDGSEEYGEATPRLNEDQLEVLEEVWALFSERLDAVGMSLGEEGRLGKRQLEGVLKGLGERMGEKEIEEMLSEGSKLYVPLDDGSDFRRGRRSKKGGEESVGKEELAGILLKARII